MTEDQFYDSIIAKTVKGDWYDASGYVAYFYENEAHIGCYSHCSCYGTLEGMGEEWSGTAEELIDIATRRCDPSLVGRTINPEDHNYSELIDLYDQIIEWSNK